MADESLLLDIRNDLHIFLAVKWPKNFEGPMEFEVCVLGKKPKKIKTIEGFEEHLDTIIQEKK